MDPAAKEADDPLPPFCGGIAGLIGYEAAWWVEPSLRGDPVAEKNITSQTDSIWNSESIPGMAIGVYDWTIAVDHLRCMTWFISSGLNELFETDVDRAHRRADEVLDWILRPDYKSSENLPTSTKTHTDRMVDRLPDLRSNFTDETFAAGVAEIISRIAAGDSFQVNLAQTLSHPAMCPPAEFYQRLRRINPAPYAGFLDAGNYQVLSSSPEGFLQVRGDDVITRPIKGTVARTGDDEVDRRLGETLLRSDKDRAENIMIVDLMRNDLSRVCIDESVLVTGLCELEKYQRVQHLVSTVRGKLRDDSGVADLLAACFPGGSITGAPKVEAMRTIAEMERRPRGAYCGSMGYVSLSGAADFNILIRTITQRYDAGSQRDVWEFAVGGGITARSDPRSETEETWVKAASLLEAIAAGG